mgnify:CR=1 FL=1
MRSHGIVLHALRYGDSSLIVDIFTEEAGTVAFLVRQPRGRRQRLAAGVCAPLSLVEVVWEHRPNANLQKPRELTLWHPWRDMPFQPMKAAVALFLGEFLHRSLHREQENKPLFRFATDALTWFDQSQNGYANFHIVFLLRLTRFLGFQPNAEEGSEGDFFDLQAATFVTAPPLHPYYLQSSEAAVVRKFLRMDFRSMRPVRLNGALRRRVLEVITLFYRLHVPEFPPLRSLDVLAEVFGGSGSSLS